MATQPTNDLLVWANTDVNLPNLAGPNKTQPSADLVAKGWDFKEKPSADEFNYILNNLGEWVEYLKTFASEATSEDTANTLALRDANGSFEVKQLISTALTGTAPLKVSSTTKVDNLNADLLDGYSTSQTATANTVVVRDSNANMVSNVNGNASTATTLQTARTINGTSFNGSSDITTSKWGTARTLTATGFATGAASIDGSGDISLALTMGSGFTNSKTTNGYTYLPNGLIFQWGYTNGNVTFPITFPNACLNASLTSNNTSTSGYDYKIAASNLTATGFSITRDSDDVGTYVYWFAIGF